MSPRIFTLGDDKGFEAQDLVAELREINVTPHVAQNTSRRCSAIDAASRAAPAMPSVCASGGIEGRLAGP